MISQSKRTTLHLNYKKFVYHDMIVFIFKQNKTFVSFVAKTCHIAILIPVAPLVHAKSYLN